MFGIDVTGRTTQNTTTWSTEMTLWKLHELCVAILAFWVVVQGVDGSLPSTGSQLLWKGIPMYHSRKKVHVHRTIDSERGKSYVMGRHSISW